MDYTLRERWCLAIGAPLIVRVGLDPRALGGWAGVARARGADDLFHHTSEMLRDGYGITSRDELIAWTRGLLHGGGERAWDMARIVAVMGWAIYAQLISDDDAWPVILVAGKLAQQAYGSWSEFAAAFAKASGSFPTDRELTRLWAELPWETDLHVTLASDLIAG